MANTSKMGRPKSDRQTRDKNVSFFLTPDDAEWITQFAKDYGFKSRSELVTAIIERAIMCKFSPIGMFRIGGQLGSYCQSYNPERYGQAGLDFNSIKPRPYPSLAEDTGIPSRDLKNAITELQQELEQTEI